MLYNAPTGSTDPNAPFIGKNVAAGILGSKVPPGAAEFPQREIVALITYAGLTPTNSDLAQLTRGVRGGQLDFDATDTGTADAILCQVGLAHTQLQAGLPFTFIKGPNSNTGNAVPTLTITDPNGNNGLTGTIVKSGGGALAKSDLPGGALITVRARAPGVFSVVSLLTISDVLALIQANAIIPAQAAVTVYTDSTSGSDTTGTGSQTAPFKTNLKAYSYLAGRFSFGTFGATIQMLTPGTYDLPASLTAIPNLSIIGSHANPASYTLTGAAPSSGFACCAVAGSSITLDGLTVNNTTISKHTLASTQNGNLTLGNVNLTATGQLSGAHMFSGQGGSFGIGSSDLVTIGASAAQVVYAAGGNFTSFGTIAVPSGGGVTDATVVVDHGYAAFANGGNSFTGTISGKRFRIVNQGDVNTYGGGANFIPGTTAGTYDATSTYA